MNLEKNREVMIENQLRPNKITNSNVLQAFMNTSKEQFISDDKINICYSDQDISIKDRRGYLKNLHLAQILHFADIKNNEKVLHIGGLTGYLSVLIAKLCKKIYVTDNDQSFIDSINKNFSTGQWLKLAIKKIKEIRKRKKIPILVGGTGLYFKSLLNGLASIPDIKNEIKDSTDDLVNKFGLEYLQRELVKKSCDFLATIEMNVKIISLNVSAAVSAILFERQRQLAN